MISYSQEKKKVHGHQILSEPQDHNIEKWMTVLNDDDWCMISACTFFFIFIYFKATWTLSRKKIVQKPPHNRAGCIVEPYNASRQAKFQLCQKVGKGRHDYVRAWPRPSRSAWAKTLQTHGFPVQTYGETSKGRNFDSKAWIKIPEGQISSFDPFCVPM